LRSGEGMGGVSPDHSGCVFLEENGVHFGVFDVVPVLANGLVVAQMRRVSDFEGAVVGRHDLALGLVGEVPVGAVGELGVVEGAPLLDGGGVGPVLLEDEGAPLDVVVPRQVFLGLVLVLRVGHLLLKQLVRRPRQEVLVLLGDLPLRGPVVHVLELRLPHLLEAPARPEHLRWP
jgi:hypothetical protein